MNKRDKLNQQAENILKELGANNGYWIDIFYGDCECEYTDERNAQSVGWHLEVDGATHDQGSHARYLGKNFTIAAKRLPQVLKPIIRAWEREWAQS